MPEIQPKAGGLGAILAGAPQLLDNLSTLTERLSDLLDKDNQNSIKGILANTNRMTDQLAETGPRVNEVLDQLDATLEQATETLAQFETTLGTTDKLLNRDGASTMQELRRTLVSARQAADALNATMQDVRPAARQVSESTLPAAEAALRDLRKTTAALRQMAESIEAGGAGGLIGGQKLPDYKP